ncbi:MAG TPA: APC family permease [Baekduia sp.]|uniref:APC family permease n=1 Tax=Baekduia sp. TaxID=2600305 RepID=UPI002D7937A0|nr:APC family permease [Baekduia sp.]HET6505993.1 APC family permease [Baekduia sp.]
MEGHAAGQKGLKSGAIGYASNVVIGVASTAPAYSLAATLGFIVAVPGVGLAAPAVLLVSFVPMLLIAFAYAYMNRADPDCGTSFAWVTRGLGPHMGWVTGWAIIAADIIVMASLAQVAGIYTFLLFGWHSAASTTWAVTLVGLVWIAVMTWICVIGIELNAATQRWLLTAEIATLALFAIVALIKVAVTNVPTAPGISLSWLNPFAISSWRAMVDGILLGIFIYWGWDSGVAVNEESENAHTGPGKAAVVSTLLLVMIYVVVSFAAQAYGGEHTLTHNSDDVLSVLGHDVFGSPLDKLLIIAVLSSASASTQTTILPTARTSLSMARWGALPRSFGRVSPRYMTPTISTIAMGAISAVWYLAVNELSNNVLGDSVTAIGFMIAWYYGFTGLACVFYYRRTWAGSLRNFFVAGVMPMLGFIALTVVFVYAYIDYGTKGYAQGYNYTKPFHGIEIPVLIGIGGLIAGGVLMLFTLRPYRSFFSRRPYFEAATATALQDPPVQTAVVTEEEALVPE